MYKINLSNIKKGIIFHIVGLIIPLLLSGIVFGILFNKIVKFNNMDGEVEAYSVEIITTSSGLYSPKHHYTVNGEEYVCESNYAVNTVTSSMKDKTVYYDSLNPRDCMTDFGKSFGGFGGVFLNFCAVFCFLFLIFIFSYFWKFIKVIYNINYLNKNGILIKNVPYKMEDSDFSLNDHVFKRPIVKFRLPNKKSVKLSGTLRFDKKMKDEDGLVDLLIDPNNYDNYYIDFEINRIGGNLDSDFYNSSNESIKINKKGISESLNQKLQDYRVECLNCLLGCFGGLFFTFVGFYMYFSTDNMKNNLDSMVEASHIDVIEEQSESGNILYSTIFYYNVDDVEYKCETSTSTAFIPDESKKTVWYDSENPNICVTEDSLGGNLLFLIVFGLLGIISFFAFFYDFIKANNEVKKIKKKKKS